MHLTTSSGVIMDGATLARRSTITGRLSGSEMYASPQQRSHNLTRRLRKRVVGEAMGYDLTLIKHCPICRTTMIVEQTQDIRLHNYECLWCGLTIQYTLPKDGHRPVPTAP